MGRLILYGPRPVLRLWLLPDSYSRSTEIDRALAGVRASGSGCRSKALELRSFAGMLDRLMGRRGRVDRLRCSGRDAGGLPPRVLEPDGWASEAAPRVRGPTGEAGRGHKPESMAELDGSDVRERNKEARLNAKSVD